MRVLWPGPPFVDSHTSPPILLLLTAKLRRVYYDAPLLETFSLALETFQYTK